MSFSYENQGRNTYLVYTVNQQDELDSLSLGMLTNNKIPGLASTIFTQLDETKYVKYNVSSKVSVRQFFTGAVNKKRLLGVFSGIVDALLSSEDYMIDPSSIMLDLDYIFADVSTCETVLICLPVAVENSAPINFSMFFKNIMFSTQFDQTENCDYVAKIINFLNSNPSFSLVGFKSLLDSIINPDGATAQQSGADTQPEPQQPAQQITYINQSTAPSSAAHSSAVKPVTPKPQAVPAVETKPNQVSAPATIPSSIPSTSKANTGFQVPGKAINQTPQTSPAEQDTQAENDDDSQPNISLVQLLMHYSKENKELYKEQKARKANAKNKPASTPAANIAGAGFAVPGQPSSAANTTAQNNNVASQSTYSAQSYSSVPVSNQINNNTGFAQPAATQNNYSFNSIPTATPVNPTPVTPIASYQSANSEPAGTTVLNSGFGETTVLGVSNQTAGSGQPYLLRMKNNERIYIDKDIFKIGKEKSYVDYFLGDNAAISRSHANIIAKNGEYFVVDTNSTNHTYVNGMMLQSNVETPITHGTKVRLANEEFEFNMY